MNFFFRYKAFFVYWDEKDLKKKKEKKRAAEQLNLQTQVDAVEVVNNTLQQLTSAINHHICTLSRSDMHTSHACTHIHHTHPANRHRPAPKAMGVVYSFIDWLHGALSMCTLSKYLIGDVPVPTTTPPFLFFHLRPTESHSAFVAPPSILLWPASKLPALGKRDILAREKRDIKCPDATGAPRMTIIRIDENRCMSHL